MNTDMNGYTWTKADTPEGRERLKELLNSGARVITRHTKTKWLSEMYLVDGKPWIETIFDANPVEKIMHKHWHFLDPSPRLEPRPLEWTQEEDGHYWGGEDPWNFISRHDGTWDILLNGQSVDGSIGVPMGSTLETAKTAIHQWRVDHLKSMIE
jgi:hypothetical protein